MFRVGRELPMTVISPQPWFPFQGVIRRFRPHFRPEMPSYEKQSGIEIYRPRFLSMPGILKSLDGLMMALGARATVRRLQEHGRADIIDAHFGYPDGYAAMRVARQLGLPMTLTMRGTEVRHAQDPALNARLIEALQGARRVFTVSASLRRLALELGIREARVLVVGNGVDASRFSPMPKAEARQALGLPGEAQILITVGGLVERKGFHRVIACLPELLAAFPKLHYVAVGSGGPEGDFAEELSSQVSRLGLEERVHFLGGLPAEGVRRALSAADAFVLSSRNEGWANVLLEAMACGLPVVASDVGGNAEVVCRPELGRIVRFGDHEALVRAIGDVLATDWNHATIRRYAEDNDWQERVQILLREFREIARDAVVAAGGGENAA
jgi:glycosyltransferase involved in cell wall biosynthesis